MNTGKAVLYARYSTDLQNDASIDDQFALCRQYASKSSLEIKAEYADRAHTSSTLHGRDGLQKLMAAARKQEFDVLLVECLDRISRNQADLATIFQQLKFARIDLVSVDMGKVDAVQVGLRGLTGTMFLADLANKIRRGQSGIVRGGRHTGGKAFGYKTQIGKPGELVIDVDEAEIVREIFERYLEGQTPREIAAGLNARGVRPPRGAYWTAGTINGNMKRGHGILQNPIYDGRIVWNRVSMVLNPDTGKRVSRPNPKEEWTLGDAPHLRIVEAATYEAVQVRKLSRGGARPQDQRKPKHFLSGRLRCGACQGGMSVKDHDHGRTRIVCSAAKEANICDMKAPVYRDIIERAVISGLRNKLTDRAAIELYFETYNNERKRLASAAINRRSKIISDLEEVTRDLDRTVSLLIRGVLDEAMAAVPLAALKSKRDSLTIELSKTDKPPSVVLLLPAKVNLYLQQIEALDRTINQGVEEGSDASTIALRDLIETVTVHRSKDTKKLAVEVRSRLAGLIGGYFDDGFELDGSEPSETVDRREKRPKRITGGERW